MTTTMRDALATYFRDNGFGDDGGYGDAWVDFELGPIPMPFPNTSGRKWAVRFHDLHHILTGYRTNTVGELEISAWEIGAGCPNAKTAFVINLSGLASGMFFAHARTFAAFRRFGIVKPQALDKATVASEARIGNDEIEKRALLGATARQTNSNGHVLLLWILACRFLLPVPRQRGSMPGGRPPRPKRVPARSSSRRWASRLAPWCSTAQRGSQPSGWSSGRTSPRRSWTR